jgi:hypothetical protein
MFPPVGPAVGLGNIAHNKSAAAWAAGIGGTASLLTLARFPQKKVLEDELAIASRKRRAAGAAVNFAISRFRPCLYFD